MNNYIFLTKEGHTFQPDSESVMPDIQNLQVIGFSEGKNPKEAFKNLLEKNEYLKDTNFNEVVCYPLDQDYKNKKQYFYLNNL
ncbi:MAG: hypothetical protein FXF47_04935 [Candidatus Mcinerneyibacterium aminivorans]|uniref:Uncharacterized protein n=1 Tax=Candidatus Mcinerneyibacterium aminivorans TaxID=2703815 RepID=A0A5D0MIL7_9BACT|nr:MAG: hypothetical protein FXF47_04935 [Candidatus Mcinerneyibacterium aminivorans]